MSTIKVDTVRPVTADASLTLQGDNSGTGVTGLTIDSSGVVNTTTAKVTNIQATSGQSLTIKDEDGNAAITIGTDNTAASYLSLNFGSYHGDSGSAGSGTLSANTLDDYEQGTFTGTLRGSSSEPGTLKTATGYYTKIGNKVTATLYFSGTTVGYSGSIYWEGLPFNSSQTSIGSVGGQYISTSITGYHYLYMGSGVSAVYVFSTGNNAAEYNSTHSGNSSTIHRLTLTYFTS